MSLVGVSHAADDVRHSHAPMMVRSRPVIERIPLRVINPIDVTVTEFGDTLVADEAGRILFRVDSDGVASVLAKDLNGILRVVDSSRMGTHLLLAEGQTGRVLRFTDSGLQSEVAHVPFAPSGLGIDISGDLLVSNSSNGQVFAINPEGHRELRATLSEPIRDLVVDDVGNAVVLLKSGKLVSVAPDGGSKPIGFVPKSSTRVTVHPNDFVLALAADTDHRPILVKPTAERGEADRFAGTPQGTVAFAFDKLGNLTLANPDLRAITRVTSHFRIPCPHCGKLVPMELSTDAPAAGVKKQRQF